MIFIIIKLNLKINQKHILYNMAHLNKTILIASGMFNVQVSLKPHQPKIQANRLMIIIMLQKFW